MPGETHKSAPTIILDLLRFDIYVQPSINLQDFDFYPLACALEPQVGARLADSESPNLDAIDEIGKRRADNAEAVFVAFRLEPQQCRDQIRRRPGGPGLRLAGDRVRNRNAVIVAVESSEQLRQPARIEINRSLK